MWHREPAVAGSFYPSNPRELKTVIEKFLANAGTAAVKGDIVGVVSPHAGYIYSGPIAAYSFKPLIETQPELVVVLALSHRARFNGAAIIPQGTYGTPLGNVEIDSEIGKKLEGMKHFAFMKEVHQMEHSLEVQVPFLQAVLAKFTMVPVIVGTIDISICREIAKGLADAMANEKRKYAVVISTDLSHYHSYRIACDMDARFIESLKSFDEKSVSDTLDSGGAEACGEAPVLAGMMLCRSLGAKRVEILKYANSGDTAGSKDQVVGYLSAAFVK